MTETTVTERETRRVDELKPGDWLASGMALEDHPAEVLGVFPYDTVHDGPSVTIVYRNSSGKPENWDLSREATLSLATEAEVAAYRDVAKREHLAAELRELADLILTHKLPMPQYGMSITASFPTAEGVRQVAEALDLEVESRKPSTGVEVEWPQGRASYERGLHVTWLTIRDEPEPAAAPEQLAAVADKLRADPAADRERHVPGCTCRPGSTVIRCRTEPVAVEPDAPTELLAIAPSADGGVAFALAPAGAVTDPVQRAKVVELTEAVAEAEPLAEHREVSGWKGEGDAVGSCGVECACGVTYDGFDSLAEAGELLKVHIANAAPVAEPCGAYTPVGPCVLRPGHTSLCSPEPVSEAL